MALVSQILVDLQSKDVASLSLPSFAVVFVELSATAGELGFDCFKRAASKEDEIRRRRDGLRRTLADGKGSGLDVESDEEAPWVGTSL